MNANAPTYLNSRVVKETREWAWAQASEGNFSRIAQKRAEYEGSGDADVVKAIDQVLVDFQKHEAVENEWSNQLAKAMIGLAAIGAYFYFLIYKPVEILGNSIFG